MSCGLLTSQGLNLFKFMIFCFFVLEIWFFGPWLVFLRYVLGVCLVFFVGVVDGGGLLWILAGCGFLGGFWS